VRTFFTINNPENLIFRAKLINRKKLPIVDNFDYFIVHNPKRIVIFTYINRRAKIGDHQNKNGFSMTAYA